MLFHETIALKCTFCAEALDRQTDKRTDRSTAQCPSPPGHNNHTYIISDMVVKDVVQPHIYQLAWPVDDRRRQ